MGSVALNAARQETFQRDPFPSGLDGRTQAKNRPGVFTVDPTSQFQAGMLVSRNSQGFIKLCTGVDVFGFAGKNNVDLGTSLRIDEPTVVVFGGTVNLKRSHISNLVLRTTNDPLGQGSGPVIATTSNYSSSGVNGTVTWNATPSGTNAPANGATVYATYTFALVGPDYDFQGRNFFNNVNDTTFAQGLMPVFMPGGSCFVFTTQFDTGMTYTIGGAGSDLYASGAVTTAKQGLVTNDPTENGDLIGSVYQIPRTDDPFLGVLFQQPRKAQ